MKEKGNRYRLPFSIPIPLVQIQLRLPEWWVVEYERPVSCVTECGDWDSDRTVSRAATITGGSG